MSIVVAFITTLFFTHTASAAPSTDRTLSFQGRLTTNTGAVVPDGYYNMEFKLYQGGTGTTANNGGTGHVWTESYVNDGGTSGVQVKNGMFSVNLGSKTTFGSSVDWNHDTLWLSMNVAGSVTACSTFGQGGCTADGEMLPMKRITATPYSINSGAVGGKTADELVQLGQGTQDDASSGASIDINKTGTGGFINLQAGSDSVFAINKAGDVAFGSATNHSISVAASVSGAGKSLTLSAGAAASGSNQAGGDLVLQGGPGDGSGANGNVIVSGGSFQVQNTSQQSILSVDTASGVVSVGDIDVASATISSDSNLAVNSAGDMTLESVGGSLSLGADTGVEITAPSTTIQGDSLDIQNGAGDSQLNVANDKVSIGTSATSDTLLVLDTKSSAGDPAGGTNGAMYYNGSTNKFRCYENGAWIDCVTPLPVSKVAESDTTNSTTTPADVTDLSFPLAANTKYSYKFVIQHDAAASTTGIGFGVTLPTNTASDNWCVNTSSTLDSQTTPYWGSYCGAGDASETTIGASGIGTSYTSTMEGYVETGADPGDLKLRMKSESANQTKVKIGSFGVLQIVK